MKILNSQSVILSTLLALSLHADYVQAQNVAVIPLAGDNGISGYEVVRASSTENFSGTQTKSVTASCPAGKIVIGGGGSHASTFLTMSASFPSNGVSNRDWRASFRNPLTSTFNITINSWAICVKPLK